MSLNNTESWTWIATRADGTSVAQYDERGAEHGFAEVADAPLLAVALVPQRAGLPPVGVALEDGARPLFWRTNGSHARLDGAGEPGATFPVATVLGWQRPDGARALVYAFEDGRVVLTDRELF